MLAITLFTCTALKELPVGVRKGRKEEMILRVYSKSKEWLSAAVQVIL
jgi:hypothetical protein